MAGVTEVVRFSDSVTGAVSDETRASLAAFAEGIPRLEGMLRRYNDSPGAPVTMQHVDVVEGIAENARIVLTMTLTKAILFSRSIIENVNGRNLLVAFHSLRGYLELVAVTRFTVKRMQPLVIKAAQVGYVAVEDARTIANHFEILLHGGRFNWRAYFDEGPRGVLTRKQANRTKEERKKFEANSLRINKCIEDWSTEHEAVEFVYDYLCDLVHPNKGSNIILLVEHNGQTIFNADGSSAMGMWVFERIFPYAVSLCMNGMGEVIAFASILGTKASPAACEP